MPSSQGSSSADDVFSESKMRKNSLSSTSTALLSRAQRRGSRTTNACEACKKRKTKCSGPAEPCEACHKADTFCHFNLKLDTRRKQAYKQDAVRTRQQYILEAVLQLLKHGEVADVQSLLHLIRHNGRPQDIAGLLRKSIRTLQQRDILNSLEIDDNDIMSLGLQGLFSHRAKRPDSKPQQPVYIPNDSPLLSEATSERQSVSPVGAADNTISPTSWLSEYSPNSNMDFSNPFKAADMGSFPDAFSMSLPEIAPPYMAQPQYDLVGQNPMVDFTYFPT